MLDKTITVLLAGGVGSRLHPLTLERAKPAVPFGGKYRIIDFSLTNCMHSNLRRILVLTQYKSHSLHKHLRDGWSIYNPELGEYITTVPPQMRTGDNWYTGTADAIYQNLYLIARSDAEYVLILSADHIYRMDYSAMLESHVNMKADVTVSCNDMSIEEAKSFGVMSVDENNRIISFAEKPEDPSPIPGQFNKALVSMGVYVFSTKILLETLEEDHKDINSSHDFGNDILPKIISRYQVNAYHFGGNQGRVTPDRYWRDVGTIDSYFEANMELLKPVPAIDLYQKDWSIRTYQSQFPPARTVPGESGTEGICINSIVSGGTVISGGSIQQSILFPNVTVEDEAFVQNSILLSDVSVGKGAQLQNCIIDKHTKIPAGAIIGFDKEEDKKRFTISEKGIVVVPKDYTF